MIHRVSQHFISNVETHLRPRVKLFRQPIALIRGSYIEALNIRKLKEVILNEQELVSRCVKKDRAPQNFLFDKFYKPFYLIAKRYLADHHLAEDAIILAFARAFKNLEKFSYPGPGSLGRGVSWNQNWIWDLMISNQFTLR